MISTPDRLLDDLAVLYELSLAIGNSLDLEECCDSFLKALMGRRRLSVGAVWLGREDSKHQELVYSNPRDRILRWRR